MVEGLAVQDENNSDVAGSTELPDIAVVNEEAGFLAEGASGRGDDDTGVENSFEKEDGASEPSVPLLTLTPPGTVENPGKLGEAGKGDAVRVKVAEDVTVALPTLLKLLP